MYALAARHAVEQSGIIEDGSTMVLAAANAVGDATSNAEDMAADATDVAEAIFEQTTEAAGEVVAEHVAQAVAGVCCVVVSWVFGDAFLDKLQINRTGFLPGPSQPTNRSHPACWLGHVSFDHFANESCFSANRSWRCSFHGACQDR